MAQTTFQVDAATLALIAELKEKVGATSNAAVLRKALAFLRVAANNSDDHDMVTIVDPTSLEKVKVLMKS